MNGRQQLKVVPPRPGGQGNKLDVVADFFCEIFSFTKFAFGLEPKLFISSYRAVVFFPDFLARFRIFLRWVLPKRGLSVSAPLSGPICAEPFPDRLPTARSRGTYWPSRGGRPTASDPPYTLHQIRRRRFEFVQWIRGIKASTGARNWRTHLRAFCGKPALAETAHRAFAPVYGRS